MVIFFKKCCNNLKNKTSFPVERWLDTEEGDGRTELDLTPDEKPTNKGSIVSYKQ